MLIFVPTHVVPFRSPTGNFSGSAVCLRITYKALCRRAFKEDYYTVPKAIVANDQLFICFRGEVLLLLLSGAHSDHCACGLQCCCSGQVGPAAWASAMAHTPEQRLPAV